MRQLIAGIICAVLAGTGWSFFSFFNPPQTPVTLEDLGLIEEEAPKNIEALHYMTSEKEHSPVKKFLPIKKPYLIHVWATWCPPCIKELPHYAKFAEKYPDKVITLSSDSLKTIQEFYKNHKISGIAVNSDKEKKILYAFDVKTLPTTFIVKEGGKIGRITGAIKWNESVIKIIKKELSIS